MEIPMRRAVVIAIVSLLLPPVAWAQTAKAGSPTPLVGLKAAATITRDLNDIAHIWAQNEHDLYLLQGYVHAQDRLFQMDFRRRQASGSLAELLGSGALSSDVALRTLGLRRAAERSLDTLSPRARAAVDAYAEGVNAFVATAPLPPEYAVLELSTFVPWTPLDTVTVSKLLTFGLSFDLDDISRTTALLTYQQAGAALGFDGTKLFFEDLFRSAPFDPASTIHDASIALAKVDPARSNSFRLDDETLALGKQYLEKVKHISLFESILEGQHRASSNQWVISGRHTTSGLPLLANDQHLSLDTPSVFYPVHLAAGPIDAIGNGFAGVPLVIVGHNRHIAWGATVNPMDVTDVFQ